MNDTFFTCEELFAWNIPAEGLESFRSLGDRLGLTKMVLTNNFLHI